MKKLIFISTMVMLATACNSRRPAEHEAEQLPAPETEQSTVPVLQAGNLLGHHVYTLELAPGVTADQLINFDRDRYIPEAEKHFPGLKGYVIKGRTGECVDCLGSLIFFESTGIRDKYWKEDGSFTELGETVAANMQPVMEEMSKLGESTTTYTDWEIIGDSGVSGPELQPGNLLGLHTIHSELAPGVTEDEWLDFMKEEYVPAFEKHVPGGRLFILRGRTGECVDCTGLLYFFESGEVRDRYFEADGSYNELGQAAYEKMQPVIEDMDKLGEWSTSYTDWLIQFR